MREIHVSSQQCKVILDAKLRDERIHSAKLHAVTTADVAQLSRPHMGFARRLDQGQCLQIAEEAGLIPGATETLQQLLQHDAGNDDAVGVQQRSFKNGDSRMSGLSVASERQ